MSPKISAVRNVDAELPSGKNTHQMHTITIDGNPNLPDPGCDLSTAMQLIKVSTLMFWDDSSQQKLAKASAKTGVGNDHVHGKDEHPDLVCYCPNRVLTVENGNGGGTGQVGWH